MTKLAYERPVMRAEAFEASNYIAACRGPNPIVEENIEISENNNWYFSATDWLADQSVTGDAVQNKLNGFDIGHTFNMNDTRVNDSGTKYWYTTGDDGGTYFLEYSNLYSQNDQDTFFLYKDAHDGTNPFSKPDGDLDTSYSVIWPYRLSTIKDIVLGIVCPSLHKKVTNS